MIYNHKIKIAISMSVVQEITKMRISQSFPLAIKIGTKFLLQYSLQNRILHILKFTKWDVTCTIFFHPPNSIHKYTYFGLETICDHNYAWRKSIKYSKTYLTKKRKPECTFWALLGINPKLFSSGSISQDLLTTWQFLSPITGNFVIWCLLIKNF